MVQISSELPPSYIQQWALFVPLAQHFMMKQVKKLTQYHVVENETIGRKRFCCDRSDFAHLFKSRNIISNIISYKRYSLEATNHAIKLILIPENVMTISRGTVKLKLEKKDVLLKFIMRSKR